MSFRRSPTVALAGRSSTNCDLPIKRDNPDPSRTCTSIGSFQGPRFRAPPRLGPSYSMVGAGATARAHRDEKLELPCASRRSASRTLRERAIIVALVVARASTRPSPPSISLCGREDVLGSEPLLSTSHCRRVGKEATEDNHAIPKFFARQQSAATAAFRLTNWPDHLTSNPCSGPCNPKGCPTASSPNSPPR